MNSLDTMNVGSCSKEEKLELEKLLEEYRELFEPVVPGSAKTAVHRIKTIPHEPIVGRNSRVPLSEQGMLDEEIRKMLADRVISFSNSPYRSPLVIVDKKDGSKRVCVDFRKLNDVDDKE